MNNAEDILNKALNDLKIYGSCAVCKHCDKEVYPLSRYCDIGGCCDYNGATKEDMWEYREMK